MLKKLSMLFCVLVTACGGGGGGGGGSSQTSISVSPSSLTFSEQQQSAPQAQTATVTFKGSGVAVGYPPGSEGTSWLRIATVSNTSTTAVFSLTADPLYLTPGNYSTTVRFATGVGPSGGSIDDATDVSYADLHVSLSILNLSVSPSSADYSDVDGHSAALSGSFALQIDNASSWTAASSETWLAAQKTAGTGPGTVGYSINETGLGAGSHSGTITVTDGGGHVVSFTVTLTLSAPLLTASPATLAFSVNATSPSPAGESLHISDNLGGSNTGKAISWRLQSISAPWVIFAPASGTSAPGADATVSISSQALSSMPNGNYSASITLEYTSEDGQAHMLVEPVTLQLDSPLKSIAVTPAAPARLVEQEAVQFLATGTYVDGYQSDLTAIVDWTSSMPVVADISSPAAGRGVGRPLSPGTATMTAQMPATSVSGSATFTVTAPSAYAYVVSYGDNSIAEYIIGQDGILVPMAFHPSVGSASGPHALAFSPSGSYAYVTNRDSASISQFVVGKGGVLSAVAPPVSAGSNPFQIIVDPSEKYVYAASADYGTTNTIRQFRIGTDGGLTPLATSTVAAGNVPLAIAAPPSGGYVYVANYYDATLVQYSIGGDGSLMQAGSIYAGGSPQYIAFSSSGHNAYVTNDSGEILQFSVAANGALTPLSPKSVIESGMPNLIALDASGRNAYVADNYRQTIAHYAVDSSGHLSATPSASQTIDYQPVSIAMDPSGKFVYLLSHGTNSVSQYVIQSNGDLSPEMSATGTGSYPYGLVIRAPR